MMTQGWAIAEDGIINMRTVSDTRRAAIVNWLVVRPKIMVYASWSDAQIEEQWNAMSPISDAEVIKVNVEKA